MEWLTGRNILTSFGHMGVDFLRKHGNKVGGNRGTDLMLKGARIKDDPGSKFSRHARMRANSSEFDRFFDRDLLRSPKLDQIHRAVLILFYEWELTPKEISDVFGRSESWASLEKTAAEKSVKRKQGRE